MTQRPAPSRPPGEMHDTIETTAFAAHPATPASSVTEKLCCHCGKSVSGQKRFKDAQGRYWCYDCGVEDHVRKHPEDGIACAACGNKFAPSQLQQLDDDDVYCEPCAAKHKQQKKREQARIHAAEEEAKAQQKRQKLMLIGGVAVAVVGVVVAIVALT